LVPLPRDAPPACQDRVGVFCRAIASANSFVGLGNGKNSVMSKSTRITYAVIGLVFIAVCVLLVATSQEPIAWFAGGFALAFGFMAVFGLLRLGRD
jgi:hypothetical protein